MDKNRIRETKHITKEDLMEAEISDLWKLLDYEWEGFKNIPPATNADRLPLHFTAPSSAFCEKMADMLGDDLIAELFESYMQDLLKKGYTAAHLREFAEFSTFEPEAIAQYSEKAKAYLALHIFCDAVVGRSDFEFLIDDLTLIERSDDPRLAACMAELYRKYPMNYLSCKRQNRLDAFFQRYADEAPDFCWKRLKKVAEELIRMPKDELESMARLYFRHVTAAPDDPVAGREHLKKTCARKYWTSSRYW